MAAPPRREIQTVERPPGWKPKLEGVSSLGEWIRQIVFDKEPGDLKIHSVVLRKITLRDRRESKRHRPREPKKDPQDGCSEFIDREPSGDPIKSGDLCRHCEKITITRLAAAASSDSTVVTDDLGGHHFTPHELERAALICPLCRLFVIAFGTEFCTLKKSASPPPPPTPPRLGQCRFKIWARNTDLDHELKEDEDLQIMILEWIDGRGKYLAELLLTADRGSQADSKGKIVTSIYSPAINAKILSGVLPAVLRQCNETHHLCSSGWKSVSKSSSENSRRGQLYGSLQVSKLPSRVVVAMWENHGRHGPFLWETDGARGVYATLSHCWSNNITVLGKTTRLNLKSHLDILNLSATYTGTKSFREAVDVCRILGIPYLWIDSLCIIQHDQSDQLSNLDDWTWEALDMGRIYKDSALTLAATGASGNPSNGLYGNRRSLAQYVTVPFKMEEDDDPNGFFYVSLCPLGFDEEVSNSRLYTRGWVLQERLLSPRYLHFGESQWFWQCREGTIAEVPGFEDGEMSIGSDLGMSQSILKDDIAFTKWWTKIAETYSRLDFTYDRDRSIALQGLVSEIQKINPQDHYYGMWSNKFYMQLLWYVDASRQRDDGRTTQGGDAMAASVPTRAVPYTPSWSWMSSPCPIGHPDPADVYEPTYEAVEEKTRDYPELKIARPAFEHRFKQASTLGHPGSGLPIIRGQIQGAIIMHPNPLHSTARSKLAADVDRSGPLARLASGTYNVNYHSISMQAALGPMKGQEVGKCGLDREAYSQMKTVFCLRVCDRMKMVEGRERVQSIGVLLLFPTNKPKSAADTPAFRRVGTGIVANVRWFEGCAKKQFVIL